jgi:ribonuclease BN (tRNA processing enzyme)
MDQEECVEKEEERIGCPQVSIGKNLTEVSIPPFMVDLGLPPKPSIRTWSGRVFDVTVNYSSAGISTSVFIDISGQRIILDCGDGCIRDMLEVERFQKQKGTAPMKRDLKAAGEAIKGLVISHPHYDHYSGLLALLNFLQLLGRETPFPIVYPQGSDAIESMVDHFTDHLWEEPLFDIDLVPLVPGEGLTIANVELKCISSEHRHSRPGVVGGPVPALSFKLLKEGETVVFSGDTGDPEPVRELARNSDLAIIETTFPAPGFGADGVHLTVDQAESIAKVAKDHMLVHFTAGSYKMALDRDLLHI